MIVFRRPGCRRLMASEARQDAVFRNITSAITESRWLIVHFKAARLPDFG